MPHVFPKPVRSITTRVLHALLLLAVLHQLIGSQFMAGPRHGGPNWPFSIHEYAGLFAGLVVVTFWAWTLMRRGETRIGRLVPWLSRTGLGDVAADLASQGRQIARGRVPESRDDALASAIHGLGLLTLTAMALTGTLFFVLPPGRLAHAAMTLHKACANLMWAYLIGHAALALLHQTLGQDLLSRMFWSRGRTTDSVKT